MTGLYPLSARHFQPWKNGGGETAEILVFPAGAGFDDFDWRISTAKVAQDGPFSTFDGVDRNLTVLEGGRMQLQIGQDTITLGPESPPFAFAGDLPCMASLQGGALLDFNVMTRRPLRAVVTRGPLRRVAAAPCLGSYALLLQPAQGLARFDLVDLQACGAVLADALCGTAALLVEIVE